MSRSLLVLAAHDARHPEVTGGDLHLQLIAEELSKAGWDSHLWTCGAPGLPSSEMVHGVRIQRWSSGRRFAPRMVLAGAAGGWSRFDLVLEQVIGTNRLPFLAHLFAPRRTVGFWYQDNRPLFRTVFRSATALAMADALQSLLLLTYERGPLLCPSETTRAWLLAQGLPADRVRVSHPRVAPPEGISPLPFGARRNRFVVIGNLRPTKRLEEAITVLRSLRREVPDAELVILGRPQDRAYEAKILGQAATSDLQGSVQVVVGATEREKFETLAGAKALTIHSPVEGFGWSVPEAGLLGVPAIVNSGVPGDVAPPGAEGGILRVATGDVAAYVRGLSSWMRSQSAWEASSSAARAAAERFRAPCVPPEVRAFLEGLVVG